MCRRRRAAGRSVCVEAACQERFKWAAPAVDISLGPAGISAHVSLPPSSPMSCRTRRSGDGGQVFAQDTAHSLFRAVFANFSHALRWRTCRYRVSPHSSLDLERWKTHRAQPVPRWKSLLPFLSFCLPKVGDYCQNEEGSW